MATTLSTFVIYALVLALVPGPDNLFVLMQAATRGVAAGFWITLGLCTGLLVHTAAVVLGIAAVIAASPNAFLAIKVIGAAYLTYLAWGALRSTSLSIAAPDERRSGADDYRRGILMNVTNPKVAMFFLAFLPQFTSPRHGAIQLQLLLLGGIFIVCTFAVFAGITLAAGRVNAALAHAPKAAIWMNRAAGVIFLALAARLLLEHR